MKYTFSLWERKVETQYKIVFFNFKFFPYNVSSYTRRFCEIELKNHKVINDEILLLISKLIPNSSLYSLEKNSVTEHPTQGQGVPTYSTVSTSGSGIYL